MTSCRVFLAVALLFVSTIEAGTKDDAYGVRCASALFEQSMSTGNGLGRRAFLGAASLWALYGGYRGVRYLNFQPKIRVVYSAREAASLSSAQTHNHLIFATNALDDASLDEQHTVFNQVNGLSGLGAFQHQKYIGAIPPGASVTTAMVMLATVLADKGAKGEFEPMYTLIGQAAKTTSKDWEMLKSAYARIEDPGYFEKNFPKHPGRLKATAFLAPGRRLIFQEEIKIKATLKLEKIEGSDEFEWVATSDDVSKVVNELADSLKLIKTMDESSFCLMMAALAKEFLQELKARKIEGPFTDFAEKLSRFYSAPITNAATGDLLQELAKASRTNLKTHLTSAIISAAEAKQDMIVLAFDSDRASFERLLDEVIAK